MLTPGEYVVRKSAVDAVGVDFLHGINNAKGRPARKHRSGGEVQYLQDGDLVGGGRRGAINLNSNKFERAVKDFGRDIRNMERALAGGFEFTHTGNINITVTLDDTAGIFSAAQGSFENIAAGKVAEGINDALKTHFPDLERPATIIGGGEQNA